MTTLRFILGDQLSHSISSLQKADAHHDVIFMCEVASEATYVKHHQKKILFLFTAMRLFAQSLREKGFNVDYVTFDATDKQGSFDQALKRAVARHKPKQVVVTMPGEYRVYQNMLTWEHQCRVPVTILEDTRYLCGRDAFRKWADGKKQLRMAFFYRTMRKAHNILMEDGQPIGGKWDFDVQNRQPAKQGLRVPEPYREKPNRMLSEVKRLVGQVFGDHFGCLDDFHYAVDHQGAKRALQHFIEHALPDFGSYQDAMLQDEPWMYHAHIGLYLNAGLLDPVDCIRAAEEAYHAKQAPLNAVEGFIRQILGWREFIRGVYWLKMPAYATSNFLHAKRPLPSFYWDGQTDMQCLKQSIEQTQRHAYAHHIQRLMVLGNFLLLIGADPQAVQNWYLLVYADAYEWVEMPNVVGMILFADGGVFASKPYAASGSYIHKMSNYCEHCPYNVKLKSGDQACPFNYLYWDFIVRHQKKLTNIPRMAMIYRTLARMDPDNLSAMRASAKHFLEKMAKGERV